MQMVHARSTTARSTTWRFSARPPTCPGRKPTCRLTRRPRELFLRVWEGAVTLFSLAHRAVPVPLGSNAQNRSPQPSAPPDIRLRRTIPSGGRRPLEPPFWPRADDDARRRRADSRPLACAEAADVDGGGSPQRLRQELQVDQSALQASG